MYSRKFQGVPFLWIGDLLTFCGLIFEDNICNDAITCMYVNFVYKCLYFTGLVFMVCQFTVKITKIGLLEIPAIQYVPTDLT